MRSIRDAAHTAVQAFDLVWDYMAVEEPERLTRSGWVATRRAMDDLRDAIVPEDALEYRAGSFHSDGPETEVTSAELVAPRSGTQRALVLEEFAKVYPRGLTDDEIGERLPLYVNTGAKRRNDLKNQGWVQDSGERRETKTGSPAVVWTLTEVGAARLRPRHT